MEVNNFEQIKSLLSFESSDYFYFLQILKRKKDNPDCPNLSNSKVIRTYYISSLEHLNSKEEEIKQLCKLHNARAYFNLNTRSFERIAFHTLKEITDRILNKDYVSISTTYDSACGKFSVGDKRWIVDIDNVKEVDRKILMEIDMCDPLLAPILTENGEGNKFLVGQTKIIATIPTKNGLHLITSPFNVQQFKQVYPDIDIQKNNPTILYYNNDK